ncbi:glycosyltransferase family 1 protein [Aquimarina sp. AU474]|uniref:glycosyltransferase family 1 protein n=1 Tax=Aquimarina sp. AU474 TaxID=2108529 RepID=UPI000D69C393|nr:glycosyltransferase family 1 protein [Aquimarina sp. AU474]
MKPIRVLQVFTIMNRGGAESMIMNYYRQLDRDKVQFDFLVHRKEEAAFDDEIKTLGGKIHRLDPINPLFPKAYYDALRSFFTTHNEYSIVHSHLNTFSSFPLKIAREFNIPCRIAHAHIAIDKVNFSSLKKEGIKETLKKIIKLRLKRKVKNHTTHLFSCGDKAGRWLFGEKSSFQLMNNAIDAIKFEYNTTTSLTYKNELNISEDTLVLGHVGRFASQKNHSFLIDVFASLLKQKEDCILLLVGDGPLKKEIERKVKNLDIQNKIQFLGVRTDIPELLQVFDIFVFPSFYEGLPVTLIEAQAAGVKVLASDAITKEVHLTKDIEFISINQPGDADLWATKIQKTDIQKKGQNTDEIIKANYDIVSNTEMAQKFYLKHA